MAEAQFTPGPSVDPFATAMNTANTMSSLFERAQRMRLVAEKEQQARELHQLDMQSRQMGLEEDAWNFGQEKIKADREAETYAKQLQQEETTNQYIDQLFERTEGVARGASEFLSYNTAPQQYGAWNRKSQFLSHQANLLASSLQRIVEEGGPRAQEAAAHLRTLDDSLNTFGAARAGTTASEKQRMATRLATVNTFEELEQVKGEFAALRGDWEVGPNGTVYMDEWFDAQIEKAEGRIEKKIDHERDLEANRALNLKREAETARLRVQTQMEAQELEASRNKRDKVAEGMSPEELAEKQQNVWWEQKKLERLKAYLEDSSKAQERNTFYRKAENPQAAIDRQWRRWNQGATLPDGVTLMAEFSGDQWLTKVEQMKGALSDSEGEKLAAMTLGATYSDDAWLNQINRMLVVINDDINDQKTKDKWLLDDDGVRRTTVDFSRLEEAGEGGESGVITQNDF